MSEIKTNRELAQEISARIGNSPIPFDSVYSICLEIYNELGGEPAEFDSVYSILLETLPLAESIAKKTSITEVDELPDAQDNNNIYRLSSDDNVYMSKLMSREYTNRLPDEQQIDKAYLYEDAETIYPYKGLYKLICTDGDVNVYLWDIYFITKDNAETITNESFYVILGDFTNPIIDNVNKTITVENSITEVVWEYKIGDDSMYVIPAIYNAPEADCIGNAILEGNGEKGIYTGEQISFTDPDEHITTGYKWTDEDDSDYCFVTLKPASEIYFTKVDNDIYSDLGEYPIYYVSIANPEVPVLDELLPFGDLYIPQLNAPDSEQVEKVYYPDGLIKLYYKGEFIVQCSDGNVTMHWWSNGDDITALEAIYLSKKSPNSIYDEDNTIELVYADDLDYTQSYPFMYNGTVVDFENDYEGNLNEYNVVNLVKYQRVMENWDWKDVMYYAGTGVTIDASNNISVDTSIIQAKLIPGTGVTIDASNNISVENPLIEITYDELKALRDNAHLVPGHQYCITDYETTTVQEKTRSEKHQFDIIVTADDVDKLNENARVTQHMVPTSGAIIRAQATLTHDYTFVRWQSLDKNSTYKYHYAWAIVKQNGSNSITDNTYHTIEEAIHGLKDWDRVYTGGTNTVVFSETEKLTTSSKLSANGTSVIGYQVRDFSDRVNKNTYFRNSKLESWEIKYCLDNNNERFAWAKVQGTPIAGVITEDVAWIRCESKDNTNSRPDSSQYQIAWAYVGDYNSIDEVPTSAWESADVNDVMFSLTETPGVGDEIYYDDSYLTVSEYSPEVIGSVAGKGVIYYMKDEWNNQVYFDFKNIMLFNDDFNGYIYPLGADDEDYTVSDAGYCINNKLEGKSTDGDGFLYIDTTQTIFYNNVGDFEVGSNYRGELITINGTTQTLQSYLESLQTSVNAKANTSYVNTNFAKVSTLTQAQYDALVSGGTVDASTLYVITPA